MNQTIDVNISPKVFNKKYIPYLDCDSRVQIYFGGSSSGKSVFLAQRDVYKILKGGRNILVCRQLKTTLRGSVIQEINKVISDWGMSHLFEINKTDGTITCIANDYQIVFAGLDDVEKLKSITPKKGVFTDIRIEEATETEYKSYKQLKKRLRGKAGGLKKTITFQFNPILQTHWLYETFFSKLKWVDNQTEYQDEYISILKTTYKDNLRFLEQDDIDDLENEDDKYYYDVYTLGNWGIIGEIIFTKWKYVNINDPECEYYLPVNQRTNRRNGGDFGFGGHPAAMTCIHLDKNHKRIYFYDEYYMRGLTNQELAVEANRMFGKDMSTWDSAEPKSIQELQIAGVNARGAKKGKDSINFGVQWLQGYEMIIDVSCIHTKKEISTYHNKTNKDGEVLRIPVDKDNHIIDASRYALEDDMEEKQQISMKAKVSNYLTDN